MNAKAWIVVALTDLNDYLAAAQVAAINTKALAAGQAHPFAAVMQDVALRIRAAVESNVTNQVSATPNAIPPELRWVACYLIIQTLQARLPGLDLEKDQLKQIDRALDDLADIRNRKLLVSIPTDPLVPSEVQVGAPLKLVSHTCRTVTRQTMGGI